MNGTAAIFGELAQVARQHGNGRQLSLRPSRLVRIGSYEMESSALALLGSLTVHAIIFAAIAAWLIFKPATPASHDRNDQTPTPEIRVRLLDAVAGAALFAPPSQTEARPHDPPPPTLAPTTAPQHRPEPLYRPNRPRTPDLPAVLPPQSTIEPTVDPPPADPPDPRTARIEWRPIDLAVDVDPTPPLTSAPPPPTPRPAEQASHSSAGQDGDVAILELPHVDYPQAWYDAGIRGLVIVEVTVLPDGRVGRVEVIHSPRHQRLVDLAVRACRQARFKPATRAGRPIAEKVRIPFRFVRSKH